VSTAFSMGFVSSFGPRLRGGRSCPAFLRPLLFATAEVAPPGPILSRVVKSGCVSIHSARAVMVGSIPALLHQAASSPERWTSRWWPRHSGTVNSSLTLRLSARLCAKRRWWASAGRRPQTRQGSLATDLTCSRSRTRRGSGNPSVVLSIAAICRRFFPRCAGRCSALCEIPGRSAMAAAKLASRASNSCSTPAASAAVSLFLTPRTR